METSAKSEMLRPNTEIKERALSKAKICWVTVIACEIVENQGERGRQKEREGERIHPSEEACDRACPFLVNPLEEKPYKINQPMRDNSLHNSVES